MFFLAGVMTSGRRKHLSVSRTVRPLSLAMSSREIQDEQSEQDAGQYRHLSEQPRFTHASANAA